MKEKFKKNWVKLLPSLVAVPGLVIMFIAGTSMNYVVAFLGILLIAAGVLYFYWIWHKPVGKKAKEKFDTIKLTSKKLECINSDFDSLPWKNLNTGERQKLLIDCKGLDELVMPDDDDLVYYYSDEYYNAITMKSNKEYFAWSDTLFQKIAIGAMLLIFVGEIVALIALE